MRLLVVNVFAEKKQKAKTYHKVYFHDFLGLLECQIKE